MNVENEASHSHFGSSIGWGVRPAARRRRRRRRRQQKQRSLLLLSQREPNSSLQREPRAKRKKERQLQRRREEGRRRGSMLWRAFSAHGARRKAAVGALHRRSTGVISRLAAEDVRGADRIVKTARHGSTTRPRSAYASTDAVFTRHTERVHVVSRFAAAARAARRRVGATTAAFVFGFRRG